MHCSFEHLGGSKLGQRQEVVLTRITIGRNPASTIAFDANIDADVSTNHAELVLGPDGQLFVLNDLNSTNGTFVNGAQVNGSMLVASGALIQFGRNGPTLIFHYGAGIPGAKGAAAPAGGAPAGGLRPGDSAPP